MNICFNGKAFLNFSCLAGDRGCNGGYRTSTIASAVSSVFLAKAPHWCCTGLTQMAVTKYNKHCKIVVVSVFGHPSHICLHLKINPFFYQ